MRMPTLLALAGLSLSACAANQSSAGLVEAGYPVGSLAVAAIDRGDWQTAERLLNDSKVSRDNPARLINLGKVYAETGRPGMALSAWREALASDRHEMVATIDGRWVSTKQLAEQALARHDTGIRSAAR